MRRYFHQSDEVLKSIIAKFDAAELITQREVVRALVFV
jgi:hypothetical protein